MTAAMATKRQILIVDDHPIVRQTVEDRVRKELGMVAIREAEVAAV